MLPKIGEDICLLDGAMGTILQNSLYMDLEVPEELNITDSALIKSIHYDYIKAGSDFITTNTFGVNSYKLKKSRFPMEDIIQSAINNARSVSGNKGVLFDIGPIGRLIEPSGEMTFDEAYAYFTEIVLLSKEKVDGYLLETFTDIYELKACVLAVKEHTDKPVYALMSFDQKMRTLTGTSPKEMVYILEGLGVDALGANCSLGPKEMINVVKEIMAYAHIPVIIQPNRGIPRYENGKAVYDLDSETFKECAIQFVEEGVSVLGGCCGTTPEFIEKISFLKEKKVHKKEKPYLRMVCSGAISKEFNRVLICGERLNPTGKKKVKEALLTKNYDFLVSEALKMEDAGADILDINCGVAKIDEANSMKEVIKRIQEVSFIPLQIDSSNKDAIWEGARYYNGLPLINSVNGDIAIMDRVFPVIQKYGGMVIGLTMDESGVPKTAIERFEIAKKIIQYASLYHIKPHQIMIDTLTLTASAEQELVNETLKALRMVKFGLNVETCLGVSNVSFGLPSRSILNRTFLTMALENGLSMPIMNPLDKDMVDTIFAYNCLSAKDENSFNYISRMGDNAKKETETVELSLHETILKGLKEEAAKETKKLLETVSPLEIVDTIIIPSLNEVGSLYEKGKLYLPQLIASSEATKKAFDVIKSTFKENETLKGPILLATVKGDVHDIGKNIVKVISESYGYKVIDLGKDCETKKIKEAFNLYHPKVIGLSALMTTSVLHMEETIQELKQLPSICPIFVGGAVLNPDTAKEIGADYYTKDALEFVNVLKEIIG